MSAAVAPLYYCPKAGWTRTPHSYLKTLRRSLTPTEHAILGVILADTVGAQGRPEWTRKPHSYYAYWANCSEDMAGRSLRHLAKLELLEGRKSGKSNEYRVRPENFAKPEERAKRTIRKPAGSETQSRPQAERTQSENLQIGFVDRNEVKPSIADVEVCYQEISNSSKSGSKSSRVEHARAIENFVTSTITPKLGSCPSKKIIQAIANLTQGHQNRLAMFERNVLNRLGIITSWGIVPMLAKDARDACLALQNIPQRAQFNLDRHWASSREVHQIMADPNTPKGVKAEVHLMWPHFKEASGSLPDDFRKALRFS